jgi:hypothetical protein
MEEWATASQLNAAAELLHEDTPTHETLPVISLQEDEIVIN